MTYKPAWAKVSLLLFLFIVAAILISLGTPSNSVPWPNYNGQVSGNRYSNLSLINTTNVATLKQLYSFGVPNPTPLETTPAVYGSTMYLTGVNAVYTYSLQSGKPGWSFVRAQTPGLLQDAANGVNRGVAVGPNGVYFATDNAHLLSLNPSTGALQWEIVMADYTQNYGSTSAPLYLSDLNLVIAGVSGGDSGARGFLAAYDANTGNQLWQFFTTPVSLSDPTAASWGDGSVLPHGCGATWLTGSYDASTKIVYWGVGNPCPDFDGGSRLGDNLYTSSVLALNATSGALQWYFQFTPHNLWDYDGTSTPVVADAKWQGATRHLMFQANRNGFFYVLDRGTGQYLKGFPYVTNLNWASGLDSNGRPIVNPAASPTPNGAQVCPPQFGANNYQSVAFSPPTGLFYVQATEGCTLYTSNTQQLSWRAGAEYASGTTSYALPQQQKHLRAINPATGAIVWDYRQQGYATSFSGVLATAGSLVFFGDDNGSFSAVDARTGVLLWTYMPNGTRTLKASPMTYEFNGRQFVAIAMKSSVSVFGLPSASPSPALACPVNAGQVGAAYSSMLTTSGGTPPYNFSVNGPLPAGLTLNSVTGAITGTPTQGNSYPFVIKVTDSSGTPLSNTANCGITITPLPLMFKCAGPTGEVGVPSLSAFSILGGVAPYSFSITSHTLPPGLNVNGTTGVLSGTPTMAGKFSYTASVMDSSGTTAGTQNVSCTTTIAPGPVVACPANTTQVGVGYSSLMSVTGGLAPFTFAISPGALPAGLSLNSSTGSVSGTPASTGSFSFAITASDATGLSGGVATSNCGITVTPPPLTLACAAAGAQTGIAYTSALAAGGGVPPYSFSVSSGTLPSGLLLDGGTGAISGVPGAVGTFAYTASVADSSGTPAGTVSSNCSITVVPAPVVLGCAANSTQAGAAFNSSFPVSGGIPPYTFTISSGSLPSGLTLDPVLGALTGAPAGPGNFAFGVTVVDSTGTQGGTASSNCAITVQPAPVVLACAANSAQLGVPYNSPVTANGGIPPYTFSLGAGSLPPDLLLDPASGTIAGTPSAAGSFGFTVSAVDATGTPAGTASMDCSITAQ